MTNQRTLLLILFLSLAGLVISLAAYPRLPEIVPSHWNLEGQVDGYLPRAVMLCLMPGMMLGLGLLLFYLPAIDPLGQNVKRFRGIYNGFICGVLVFLLFLHGLTILAGIGIQFNMTRWMLPAMAILTGGMGFLLERTKPNWFIGIRTPWTLHSPTVWDKTHRLGGRLYKLTGLVILAGLVFPSEIGLLLALIPLFAASLATVIYSYFLYRAEQNG